MDIKEALASNPGYKGLSMPNKRVRIRRGNFRFGKFLINKKALCDHATICVRYATTYLPVRDLPKFSVSSALKDCIKAICEHPAPKHYPKALAVLLSVEDQEVLARLLTRANVYKDVETVTGISLSSIKNKLTEKLEELIKEIEEGKTEGDIVPRFWKILQKLKQQHNMPATESADIMFRLLHRTMQEPEPKKE